jgi:chorismate mutase
LVKAVRGAIAVNQNTAEAIGAAARRLLPELMKRNRLTEGRVISVLFSLTRDLTAGNPATAARSLGFAVTPLFCLQEAHVEGAPGGILRVLLTFRGARGFVPQPVYLDGAERLRPDLAAGGGRVGGRA